MRPTICVRVVMPLQAPPIDVKPSAASDVPTQVIDTRFVSAADVDLPGTPADSGTPPPANNATEETPPLPAPASEVTPATAEEAFNAAAWEDPRLLDQWADVPDDNFLLAFGHANDASSGGAAPPATPMESGAGGSGTGAPSAGEPGGASATMPAPLSLPNAAANQQTVSLARVQPSGPTAPVSPPVSPSPASPAQTAAPNATLAPAAVTPTASGNQAPAANAPARPALVSSAAPSPTQAGSGGLTGIDPTILATEGALYNGPIAEFTDSDGNVDPTVYVETTDWGDGSPQTSGTITYDTTSNTFSIQDEHEYLQAGSYTLTATVVDTADGDTVTITSPVTVADAALTAIGPSNPTIQFAAGQPFAGYRGSFVDADPNGQALEAYGASIDWGDGTAATDGTVTNGPNNTLFVSAAHSYSAGSYSGTITLSDPGGGSVTSTFTATVVNGALAGNPGMPSFVEGAAATPTTLATFLDPSGVYDPSAYQTTITWGDNSPPSAGTVTYTGNSYLVQAGHDYSEEGTYPLSISITNNQTGGTTTVNGLALVSDAALTATAAGSISTNPDGSFAGTLGTVIDANPGSVPADLSGTIDWGDGSTPTPATITANGQGQYTISGAYQWSQADTYNITVSINDVGGSQVSFTVSASAIVYPPPAGTSVAASAANGVNISQVYARGGQPESIFAQDYLELVNTNPAAVSLSGWSLQYADVMSGTWQVAPLTGTLQPGQYYLVQAQTGPSGQGNIPTPDLISSLQLGSAAGKVALVNSTAPLVGTAPAGTTIIDFVGYGVTDAYEGAAAAPVTDPTTADVRGSAGFAQTEQNGDDFSAATPDPHNSAAPVANFPPVDTVPAPQWMPQDTPLYFSSANGNALSVSDYDAGNNSVEVSLLADNGTVTLATLSGLTLVQGTGTNDTEVTFDGPLSAVNAALNGLEFTPTSGFTGPAVLAISTDDLGDNGGADQTDIETVLVSVGGPLVAVPTTASTDENSAVNVDVLANDAYVHSDALSLSLVSGPANGQVVVDPNSPPGYPTFLYTPNNYFSGSDSFVYQVSDGYGNTAEATVTVTVNSVNFALINPPPDQVNDEGDSISIQLQTPNNDGSVPLTFAAAGLPAGLSIDPTTGIISGIPLYTDAETNGGAYTVTVSASGPGTGDSDSETFTWTINDTNRIVFLDDEATEANSPAEFDGVVQDNLGDALTYSFSGLPPGLIYDPSTGIVSGEPPPQAQEVTPFAVTFQVTGGGDTDTRTFTWDVITPYSPLVLFALNDTLSTDDDVAVVGQQVPVRVQFFDGVAGINPVPLALEVPSGLATLSTNEVQLSDQDSAEITLTAEQPSVQGNDVQLVAFAGPQFQLMIGQAALTAEQTITISTGTNVNRIRAADTPAAMTQKQDRIPLRALTPYTVKFVGAPTPKTADFSLRVLGESAANGTVAFVANSGGEWKQINIPDATYKANLVGENQTAPGGNAGNLVVAVFAGFKPDLSKPLKKSAGFSVAAIPVTIAMGPASLSQGKNYPPKAKAATEWWLKWGARYDIEFSSDSLFQEDLDQVKNREVVDVRPGAKNAALAILGPGGNKHVNFSSWGPTTSTTAVDYNGYGGHFPKNQFNEKQARSQLQEEYEAELKKGEGTGQIDQYFQFYDLRTGMTTDAPAPVARSGYLITVKFYTGVGGGIIFYKIDVQRSANGNHGVQAGWLTSNAGQKLTDTVSSAAQN